MQALPTELVSYIADFLTAGDVLNLIWRVCKRFYLILTHERGLKRLSGTQEEWYKLRVVARSFVDTSESLVASISSLKGLVVLQLNLNPTANAITLGLWRLSACTNLSKIVIPISRRLWIRPITDKEKREESIDIFLKYGPDHTVMDMEVTFPKLKWFELVDPSGSYADQYVSYEAIKIFGKPKTAPLSWNNLMTSYLVTHLPKGIEFVDFGVTTSGCLNDLAEYPCLTSLDLRSSKKILLSQLRDQNHEIASRLKSLTCSNHYDYGDIGNLAELGSVFRGLTYLKIWLCSIFCWDSFGADLPNLTTLIMFRGCITYEGALTMPQSLTHLEVLEAHSLAKVCKEYTREMNHSMATPFILQDLFTTNTSVSVLEALPKTLKVLRWKSMDEKVPENLAYLARSLTSLNLESSHSFSPASHFVGLPESLTKLEAYFEPTPDMAEQLPQSLLTLSFLGGRFLGDNSLFTLPRNLTDLVIQGGELPAAAFKGQLLRNLTSLNLQQNSTVLSDDLFPYLPRYLKTLRLLYPMKITGVVVRDGTTILNDHGLLEAILGSLPKELAQKLRIKMLKYPAVKFEQLPGGPPELILSDLPASVTELNMVDDSIQLDLLQKKHLRHLSLKVIHRDYDRLVLRYTSGRKLESLHLGCNGEVTTRQLPELSPKLVELCIPNLGLVHIKGKTAFPDSLRKLTVRCMDLQTMENVLKPSNVIAMTIIEGGKLHTAHFTAMPRSLTKLKLGSYSCSRCQSSVVARAKGQATWQTLSTSSLNALPPALTQLDLQNQFRLSSAQISTLCEKLPHLQLLQLAEVVVILEHLKIGDSTNVNLPGDAQARLQSNLPKSLVLQTSHFLVEFADHDAEMFSEDLKELTLMHHQQGITDIFLTSLPATLTKLDLFAQQGLSHKNLPFLPPNLTHLSIVAKNIKADGLSSLPPSMRFLHLIGPTSSLANLKMTKLVNLESLLIDEPTSLKDSLISHNLPSSLTQLWIGSTGRGLSSTILSRIPLNLKDLQLYGVSSELFQAASSISNAPQVFVIDMKPKPKLIVRP